MKIIEKPSVYLIAKTIVRTSGMIDFVRDSGIKPTAAVDVSSDAEFLSEVAGRLCYWSFDNPRPGGTAAYLDRIKSEKHGSVLEHASFSFLLTGISRSLSHELVRHRAGFGFSQLSQRYVDESDCAFVVPIELLDPKNIEAFGEWRISVGKAHDQYCSLVASLETLFGDAAGSAFAQSRLYKTELRKRVRQTARSVLPNSTETKIMVTANCRAWRHFIEQRGSGGAEPEIRRLAVEILRQLKEDSPIMFADYYTETSPLGTGSIKTMYPKV